MQIGRKIYYEKTNGIVIWDKGDMEGSVVETTLEQDKEAMPILTMVDTDQLGVLQLNFGDYAEDFATCLAYKIDPITQQIEFLMKE